MDRTAETVKLNSELQIVKLRNIRFYDEKGETYVEPYNAYCFFHPEHGYVSFRADNRPGQPKSPYIPVGGKKGLERIQAQGGFLQYNDIEWIPVKG